MSKDTRSIYQQLKDVVRPDEIDHHESDLYVKVTEESKRVIAEYPFRINVSVFSDNITHSAWYEIPFEYEPFWRKKGMVFKGIEK